MAAFIETFGKIMKVLLPVAVCVMVATDVIRFILSWRRNSQDSDQKS